MAQYFSYYSAMFCCARRTMRLTNVRLV